MNALTVDKSRQYACAGSGALAARPWSRSPHQDVGEGPRLLLDVDRDAPEVAVDAGREAEPPCRHHPDAGIDVAMVPPFQRRRDQIRELLEEGRQPVAVETFALFDAGEQRQPEQWEHVARRVEQG